jgi:GNAT superfamily N-acetyltransferase
MDITFRGAQPEDLPECINLFNESVADLRKRHNMPEPSQQLTPARRLLVMQHILAHGIFHVAERDGKLLAYACANLRDRLWFLSGFWARPAVQKQHIGMQVLRRVWEEGRERGATTYFVWASSDLPAMAAYMKMGMLPGTQILTFEGTPGVKRPAPATYTTQPLNKSVAMGLDKVMLGARREEDHDHMLRSGWEGMQVMRGGIGVGYYYIHNGSLGPAAWTHPRHSDALLALACQGREQVSMGVPGMNHDAIQFALSTGLRLASHSHLLTTSPFGHLERYIPSGPYFF